MSAYRKGRSPLQLIISIVVVTLVTLATILACMATINVPCLQTYYDELPIYPDATLVDETRSPLQWIGLAQPSHVWLTDNSIADSEGWVEGIQRAVEENDLSWNGEFDVQSVEDGTEIRATVACVG
ncbi:MAG: hypothetical protein AAFR81_16530 [Chloroflexota bacterium]